MTALPPTFVHADDVILEGGGTISGRILSRAQTVGARAAPATAQTSDQNVARGRPERVRIAIEAVELNPEIDDGRFKAPAGTRR